MRKREREEYLEVEILTEASERLTVESGGGEIQISKMCYMLLFGNWFLSEEEELVDLNFDFLHFLYFCRCKRVYVLFSSIENFSFCIKYFKKKINNYIF